MIAITTTVGTLRIVAEIPIPNAQSGQWDQARIAKLLNHITNTVNIAEMVDEAASQIDHATLPARKPNFKSGLVVVIPED